MATRKLLLFTLASGMALGGLYLLAVELPLARVIYFRAVIGGAILASVGACLPWVDFIAPLLGVKTWEDQ